MLNARFVLPHTTRVLPIYQPTHVLVIYNTPLLCCLCTGKCAGSTPLSEAEAVAHRALGVRFFYTQPLGMAHGGMRKYIQAVDPGHHSL
jgi:hypothetical protein